MPSKFEYFEFPQFIIQTQSYLEEIWWTLTSQTNRAQEHIVPHLKGLTSGYLEQGGQEHNSTFRVSWKMLSYFINDHRYHIQETVYPRHDINIRGY